MYHETVDNRFQIDAGQTSGAPIWYVSDDAYERAIRRGMRERSAIAGRLVTRALRFLRGR